MKKGENSRKERFIHNFSQFSLEDLDSDITLRCKFNFSYFDYIQEFATDIATWDESNLQNLFTKIKSFSGKPLLYWKQQCIGSHRNHVLEIYGAFPRKSGFSHPSHVPSDVDWARFRLDGKKRLIGFTIPKNLCRPDSRFDDNTFYVVFLDFEHNFYRT
ncbi:MAG: hypothetical protein PHO09_09210 [Sphaerochaeta sp.]|nr:hypothetical protein [Sphaerochaeta sp.]